LSTLLSWLDPRRWSGVGDPRGGGGWTKWRKEREREGEEEWRWRWLKRRGQYRGKGDPSKNEWDRQAGYG
jgi:hypothetical protein